MPPLTDTGTEYLLHICHPSKQNTTQKGTVHTDDGKQPNRQLRSLPCRELPLAANRINGAADSAPKIKIYKSGLLEKNFLFFIVTDLLLAGNRQNDDLQITFSHKTSANPCKHCISACQRTFYSRLTFMFPASIIKEKRPHSRFLKRSVAHG